MCNVCNNALTELARIPLLVLPGFWSLRAWHPGRSICTECCLVLQVLPLAKALLNYVYKCLPDFLPDFSDIHESCHRSANRRRRDWKHAESQKAAWMLTLKNRRFLPSPRLERVAGDVFQCGTWKKQRKMWPPRDSYIGSTWMLWILKLISFNLGMATSSGTLKALALAGCCLSENRSALFQAPLPGTGTQRLFAPHREPLWLVLRQLAVAQQQTPSWCSSGFLWRPLLATGYRHGVI